MIDKDLTSPLTNLELRRFGEFEIIPGISFSRGIKAIWEREKVDAESLKCLPPPNPFHPGQVSRIIEWLQEVPLNSRSGLPRYLQAIYDEREDLQLKMPEVSSGELGPFSWWLQTYGRRESSTVQLLGHRLKIKRQLDTGGRVNNGADVIGFFNAEHGIGEAARLLVTALRSEGVAVSTIGYRNTESRQKYQFETDEIGQYRTVISSVNAELNKPVRDLFGQYFFHNTYVIGQWFWELEVAPPWYRDAYQYVDELWAPTKFIEEMLRREAPSRIHVEHMPLPLSKPQFVEDVTRSDLGLDNRYMFLFTFDFMSVMKRKNPLGLVAAFKKAFAANEGPILVLKCVNGEHRPTLFQELRDSCAERPDIIIMNKYLDPHSSAALMNLCDCYVSLHRSEGLGLTIAEAMLLGKPVVATGYSGNLDFMTPETSFMVPWSKVKVGKGAEAYSAKATWAEPDIHVAAEMMRYVYQNPEAARLKAEAGRQDLEARFTPTITGARMKDRLEKIWRQLDAV
jgi:glycosyltransferase involved in cell wall biosynthesis